MSKKKLLIRVAYSTSKSPLHLLSFRNLLIRPADVFQTSPSITHKARTFSYIYQTYISCVVMYIILLCIYMSEFNYRICSAELFVPLF